MRTAIAVALLLSTSLAFGMRAQDDAATATYHPVYAKVESVYFAGAARLQNGSLEIALPSGFETLVKTDGRSIALTCKDGWSPLYATSVANGKFTVRTTDSGRTDQEFWWEVKGPMNR